MRARLFALAFVPVLSLALVPDEARACGGVEHEVSADKMLLVDAEQLLDAGQLEDAALQASSVNHYRVSWSDVWWRSRILAVASVRSNGRVSPHVSRPFADDATAQERNLKDAVRVLSRMTKHRALRDDPTVLAAIGEGLAQLPGREEQALRMLQKLADDDVMPNASAWAALARLQSARGLEPEVALAGCRALTDEESAARECTLASAQGSM